MARGSDQATGAATSAQNISNSASGNAGALYSTLAPELQAAAANPAGFGPEATAKMDTAALQTAGGSQAGAVGQGALQAARTRNAGSADAAIAKSSRSAGETASQGILGTQIKDSMLKQSQRQAALSGMGSLFGANMNAGVNSLGQVASNVNADTNAQNESWDWAKFILDPAMKSAATAATAFA